MRGPLREYGPRALDIGDRKLVYKGMAIQHDSQSFSIQFEAQRVTFKHRTLSVVTMPFDSLTSHILNFVFLACPLVGLRLGSKET